MNAWQPVSIPEPLGGAIHPGAKISSLNELGKELQAHQAARMLDRARGLHVFHAESSLAVAATAGTLQLLVRHLEGITPRGRAVVLESYPLSASWRIGLSSATEFELAVEVNPPYPAADADDDQTPRLKYRLHVAEGLSDQEALGRANLWGADLLWLGRFRWDAEAGVARMIRRPPVTRLTALRPFDQRWREWLDPLLTKLAEIARDNDRPELAREAKRLLKSWPTFTLHELANQLTILAGWEFPENPMTQAEALDEPFPDGLPGTSDELPQKLAARLEGLSAARGDVFDLVEGQGQDFERIHSETGPVSIRLLKALKNGQLTLDYGAETPPRSRGLKVEVDAAAQPGAATRTGSLKPSQSSKPIPRIELYRSAKWEFASHTHDLPALPVGAVLTVLEEMPSIPMFPQRLVFRRKHSAGA